MADPRFYRSQGPIPLGQLAAALELPCAGGLPDHTPVHDVAALGALEAGLLGWAANARVLREAPVPAGAAVILAQGLDSPAGCAGLHSDDPQRAFARACALLYPDWDAPAADAWPAAPGPHPDARIGVDVRVGPGAVIAAGADIADGAEIGPNAVIGPGVAIGRGSRIGANVTVQFALIGDQVTILSGAQIGQRGFGYASSAAGHLQMPQLGRVIIQDRVDIGAGVTIDRGALGDTVIGEGTKIDNLVQIGHNVHIGRHCVIVAQVGISGSVEMGDFVVLGGQAGIADHSEIGDGARFAARSALHGRFAGGQDYGGAPAQPVKDWMREMKAIRRLGRGQGKGT